MAMRVMAAEASEGQADARPALTLAKRRAIIAALSVAVGAFDLARGTGFVLDDWYWLRNAAFHGAAHAATAGNGQAAARPGAGLVYAFVFGVLGRHPLPVVVLMSLVGLVVSLLLLALLERYLPWPLALTTVACWVVFANHTSLEVWASCANIPAALALGCGGLLVGLGHRTDRGAALAGLLMAAACLCYQAVLPVLVVGLVVLPWVERRRADRRLIAWSALWGGAALAWMALHWDRAKSLSAGYEQMRLAIPAHFGWGIVPDGPAAALTTLAAGVGVVVAVWLVATRRLTQTNRGSVTAIVSGLAVIVLGLVPFAGYRYEPLGAGDRASCVTAIGGALIWAGVLGLAWTARRGLAVVVGALLLVGGCAARWQRVAAWHAAGADAEAALAAIAARCPPPGGVLVVTPRPPVRQDVSAFLDRSNIEAAAQLACDDPSVAARFARSEGDLSSVPPEDRLLVHWSRAS